MRKLSSENGFTTVEILVVLVVISLIMGILFVFIPDARRQSRDKERQSDIDTLHSRLEEYYQEHGSYPSAVTTTVFPPLDPTVLVAPNGNTIKNNAPVANQFAARNTPDPTLSGDQYTYTAYPSGCANNCVGYILKTVIETPSAEFPNPYIQGGLHNN